MKTFVHALLSVVIFTLCSNDLRADAGYSFNFIVEQKKLSGGQTQSSGSEIKTKEEWAYKGSMENKSFKDAANLEIKYLVFMKPDQAGAIKMIGQAKLKRKQGETKVALIKNFDKYNFTTDSVVLTGIQLAPGWVWASGANPRSKDALRGLWMRVFVDGKQVAEYINPPGLKDKETWDDK